MRPDAASPMTQFFSLLELPSLCFSNFSNFTKIIFSLCGLGMGRGVQPAPILTMLLTLSQHSAAKVIALLLI